MAIDLKLFKVGTDKAFKVGGSVAGYKPFSPTNISSCILWLDADDNTKTIVTGRISEWRDKSGNDNHFTQTTATNRPYHVTNFVNGLSAVNFLNSENNALDCIFPSLYSQPNTIITVWNLDVNSTQTSPIVYDRVNIFFGSSNRNVLYWSANNISILGPTNVTAYAKNRPFSLISSSVIHNGVNTKVFENGVLKNTVNAGTGGLSSLRLGNSEVNLVPAGRLSGNIMEQIIYNKELTTDELLNVNTYLSGKYGF